MSDIPQEGEIAPIFEGQDAEGHTLSLATFRGKPLILYFYPKDDTPGCTAEACAFRDHKEQFDTFNTALIGISPDTPASHAKFIQKHGLNFTLLSDPEHKICETYGVWQEKNNYGKKSMGVVRSTFIIDEQGIVRWMESPVKMEGHPERILTALKKLTHAFKRLI